MLNLKQGQNIDFSVKLAASLISLIAIVYIFIAGKEVLSPLLYSFLFSMLLFPLSVFFEKRLKLPRGAAAGLAVIIFVMLFSCIGYFVGSQISNITSEWPTFKQNYTSTFLNLQHWIADKLHVNMARQLSYVNNTTTSLATSSNTIISATVLSFSSMVLFIVFIMIDTFFFLFYRGLLIKFLITLFKDENSAKVHDIIEQVQYIIRKYILGLLIEMAIVTFVACTLFSVIGIRYAILLGFITGILNIIPYVGIFTSLILCAFITIGTAASSTAIFLVTGSIIIIHLTDSNFLLPFLVGSKVKINAFITLLGVIVGEMIWGISGMFLSIPIIAISKIVFDRIEFLKPWGLLLGEEKKGLVFQKITKVSKKNKIPVIEACVSFRCNIFLTTNY